MMWFAFRNAINAIYLSLKIYTRSSRSVGVVNCASRCNVAAIKGLFNIEGNDFKVLAERQRNFQSFYYFLRHDIVIKCYITLRNYIIVRMITRSSKFNINCAIQ